MKLSAIKRTLIAFTALNCLTLTLATHAIAEDEDGPELSPTERTELVKELQENQKQLDDLLKDVEKGSCNIGETDDIGKKSRNSMHA